jgi:hypothetical protein
MALGLLTFAGPALADNYQYNSTAQDCDQSWITGACWDPPGSPGQGDTATIDNYVTLTTGIVGLTGLTVTAGGIEGFGSLEVAAGGDTPAVMWAGNGLLGVKLTIDSGVTSSFEGIHISGGELDNAGDLIWLSGDFIGDTGGIVRNSGSFTIAPTAGAFRYGAGDNTCDFYNTGTISDTNPGTTNNPDGMWGFHLGGTLSFSAGGTLEWRTSSNTQHNLNDGAIIDGNGTLLFDQPTNSAGDLSVVTIAGTTTVGTGSTLQIGDGAQLNLGATASATIGGAGTFLWTGGNVTANETYDMGPSLTFASPLVVHLTGISSKDTAGGYIINETGLVWDEGQFGIGDGSYFKNVGTFTINGDATDGALSVGLSPTAGTYDAAFENDGTVVKSTGPANLVVTGMSVLNKGTIDAASGEIVLLTTGNTPTGGSNVLAAGSTLSGNIVSYCEVTLDGASTVSAGSTFELGADTQGDLAILDGNGSLGGAGTIKIDGASVSPTDPATITFAAGGNVLFTKNATTTNFTIATTSTLDFAGTTSWASGDLEVEGGTLTNSGVWTTTSTGSFSTNSSASFFTNSGTLTFDPGASKTNTMLITTTNTGTVTVKSGTALWGSGYTQYTQTAGNTVLAGGELSANLGGGDWGTIDIQGGTLSGSGTVDAIVTNEGTFAPGTATAAGNLTVTQTYTQTGSLDVALGGTTAGAFDVLSATSGATLGGALVVSLLPGYVPAVGDSYKVVAASGGVSGKFHQVTQPTGVTLTTTYGATDVVLGVTQVSIVETPDAGVDAASDGGHVVGTPDGGHAVDAATDSGHVVATPDSGHVVATPDSGHAVGTPDSGHGTRDAVAANDAGTSQARHDAGKGSKTDASAAADAGQSEPGSTGGCSTARDASTGGSALGWLLGVGLGLIARRARARRAHPR